MRAAIFKGVGLPLAIENIPDPTPGAGEVVMKVGRCGMCGSDLHMTDGHSPAFSYSAGAQMGHEFAGEVVALGAGVSRLKIGDRITALPFHGCGACASCLSGKPNFCVEFRGNAGGFAEYALTAERVAIKLPASLGMDDGALVEPLAVGMHGVALAKMEPGAKVLVIGAGPIGLAAAFWARQLGAGQIAVTASSRRRESLALQMGANHFVMPEQGQSLAEASAAALGGAPDVVFECVGKNDLIAEAVNCVRPAGCVVVLGFCTVPDSFIPALAVWKEVRMQFSVTYSMSEFEHVARVLDGGHLEPRAMITETVSLDQLPATFEALRDRTSQCKVQLDPWA